MAALVCVCMTLSNFSGISVFAEKADEAAYETIDAIPGTAPENEPTEDETNTFQNRFEKLTGSEIIKVFSQQPEGIRSLYSGITEEEWETVDSILNDEEKATLNSLLAGAGCIDAPQTVDADGLGYELTSIGPAAVPEDNKAALTEYLKAHAGTYVTEKNYTNGVNTYEGSKWSVEIAGNGEDVKLFYDGNDTKAVVSAFGELNAETGAFTSINFELTGEDGKSKWTTEQGNEEKVTLEFRFHSAGYIQFPNKNFWWDKDDDGEKEQYKFSNAVYMYNRTLMQNYFRNYIDTYSLNDGSGWKIEIGRDGIPHMTDAQDPDDITIRHVSFGDKPETYGNVTGITFESPTWYNNDGTTGYQSIDITWEPLQGVSSTEATDNYSRPEGFVRNAFKPRGTVYKTDKSIIKSFKDNSSLFTPDKGDFSTEYFKDYPGEYLISEDYGKHYDSLFEGWKLEIDENGRVWLNEGTKGKFLASFVSGRNEKLTLMTDHEEWRGYVNQMCVCVPGYYNNAECTEPAYLTLAWQINNTDNNVSEGDGAWRFQTNETNFYKAGADGNAELLHVPAIYCEHAENYIGKAREFFRNYVGTYYYNYAGTTGEYMQITKDGDVVWYCYDGNALVKRTPLYYAFSNNNYLNGDPSMDNQWTVSQVIFGDDNWYENDNKKPTDGRRYLTMNYDLGSECFCLPDNYPVYSAQNNDVPGQLLRIFNELGPGSGGRNRERYIRFDKVNEFLADAPREYTLNDNSGWKITIDANGQPTLTDSEVLTEGNIKIQYVEYNLDGSVYPQKKTGLKKLVFTSPDWYNREGTQNYQTLSLEWSKYVSADSRQSERPEGFVRYVFNARDTLWGGSTQTNEDGSPKIHDRILKFFRNDRSYFAADGGYANEYFKNYKGEYPLAPGFGENYNSMYKNWKIVVDDYGSVSLHTNDGIYRVSLASANRTQKYDADGQRVDNQFVPSVRDMYVYMPGYYNNAECTEPAYLTLTWQISSKAEAKDHSGEPYKYFSSGTGCFYKPDADGDGQPEIFKAPALYFMHTDYVNWYKNYYKQFAGRYYINSPGTTDAVKDEYIEIKDDGTPVYHAFDGVDHEAAYVNISNGEQYLLGDETVYPNYVRFVDDEWYGNPVNNTTNQSPRNDLNFTWQTDWGENSTQARRFTVQNRPVYAKQAAGADAQPAELLRYFSDKTVFTYLGSAEFNPSASEENPTNDNDKTSIAEMKQYLRKFAYIPNEANEYTEYSFNDPNVGWGIRITKDGDVLVDFDDTGNNFVKVNPRPEFGQSTNTAVGINGRYLRKLYIEVPEHYSDEAATQPAFITLEWANANKENIAAHYFTAEGTVYHKADSQNAHKVMLNSRTERFEYDADTAADKQYMAQFAGEYYANDGSDWGINITDQGALQIRFGTEDYQEVAAAMNVDENAAYGRYVSQITVPLDGWYSNVECSQPATLTLTPRLRNTGDAEENAHMNNYFTLDAACVYRPDDDSDEDEEPQHMTISALEFGSQADYVNAKQWLAQSNYTGKYEPQMTDKWYAEIETDGSIYFYVDNGKDADGNIQYKKIKPRVTLARALNETTYVTSGVTEFSVMFPNARTSQSNERIQNIEEIKKVSFGTGTHTNGDLLGDETYYIYAKNNMLYDSKNGDADWEIVTDRNAPNYNKTFTKLYENDRAYSDKNRDKAREYFKDFAGMYYTDDPGIQSYINISEQGDITWVPEENVSGDQKIYNADAAFDSDRATLGADGRHLPKTINVLYNGFRTEAADRDDEVNRYTPVARGDITWDQYGRNANELLTYHTFTAGVGNIYKDNPGSQDEQPFSIDRSYRYFRSEGSNSSIGLPDGEYKTADLQHKIVIETENGRTAYTFVTPDGGEYPLSALGTEESGFYIRGKIGETFTFGTFYISYGALMSASNGDISYRNKAGQNVTIPAGTPFTNYGASEDGNIVVVNPGETINTGKTYAHFAKAMGAVEDGGTIYLKDDVTVGYMAELVKSADGKDKTVTIDGQGHTISRAKTGDDVYTGSLFKVNRGDNLTFRNVRIDAGAYWYWDNDMIDRLIQISVYGVRNSDGDVSWYSDPYAHGGGKPVMYGRRDPGSGMLDYTKPLKELDFPETPYDPNGYAPDASLASDTGADAAEGTNITTTDNLIRVGGTVTLENTEIGYMSTYNAGTDTYGSYAVFGVTDTDATINMNEGTDIHNIDANGGQLVRDMKTNTTVNMTGAKIHECHSARQDGGLMSAGTAQNVVINKDTDIYDVYAYNCYGSVIMVHGGNLTMNGGRIHHIFGSGGTNNNHGTAVYLHNNSSFQMTGGEIDNNIAPTFSAIYQLSASKGMNLDGGKLRDNMSRTREYESYGGQTDMSGDVCILGGASFGADMYVDDDVVVERSGHAENFGTLNGSVTVLGPGEGESSAAFKNYGDINGDLLVQNGADVTNEKDGKINGIVTVTPSAAEDETGSGCFVNAGEIHGTLNVEADARVLNSGCVDADVTAETRGEIILDGGRYIEGDVTLYPGSELRTNDNRRQGRVAGKITVEYGDEEDKRRFEDILTDSNISAEGGIEYVQHEHNGEQVTREATCYEEGVEYVDCACGERGNYKVLPMKPHNLTLHPELNTEATCTEPARIVLMCDNDGCEYRVEVETGVALGHDPVRDTEHYVAPTTVSNGLCVLKCSRCDEWTETVTVPMLSIGETKHNFSEQPTEKQDPTCGHSGFYTYTCVGPDGIAGSGDEGECGQTLTVEVPATPHNFGPNPTEKEGSRVEPADCTHDGSYVTHRVCQVCGEGDPESEETVTIPAPGHKWLNKEINDGWVVDEASRKYCTNETIRTRTCSVCGETETAVARAKSHTWVSISDGELEKCSECGMVRGGLSIDYVLNGGNASQTLLDEIKKTYAPGDEDALNITLWQPVNEEDNEDAGIKNKTWTKQTTLGNAVFVGWSTVDCGETPYYSEAPADAKFVTTVSIPEGFEENIKVYAVWALDRNNNMKADYNEDKVSLSYNAMGGQGQKPGDMTDLLVGASYPLITRTDLTKTMEDGSELKFAGWSVIPTAAVIPAGNTTIDSDAVDAYGNAVSRVTWKDAGGAEQSVELVTSPYTIPNTTAGSFVYLYAVYAETDNSGNVGFDSEYCHVEYYAPGAIGKSYNIDEDTGLFYICNDHHSPGEQATLMTTQSASVMIYKPGAVLIGWTQNEEWNSGSHELITNERDEAVTIVNSVTAPENGNAKVYAVWAEDTNNNGIPDYYEELPTEPETDSKYIINDVAVSDGTVNVNVTKELGADSKLIVAAYSDGTLVNAAVSDISLADGATDDFSVNLNTDGATYIVVFIWDSLANMVPLSDKFSIDL